MLFMGTLCFPPFRKNAFLVITFALKLIWWWFWCLGLCSEGQELRWWHLLWWLVCLSVICLPVCSSVSQSVCSVSVYLQLVCLSVHPMVCPTVCLVCIEVNYLTVTTDCSCLAYIVTMIPALITNVIQCILNNWKGTELIVPFVY